MIDGRRPRTTHAVLLAGLVAAAALLVGVTAPVATPPAAAQVTPGCVVDLTGMLGWWRGEDDLTAEVGPDLTGSTGFDGGIVGQAPVLTPASAVSTPALGPAEVGLTVETWVKPEPPGPFGRVQALASRWDVPSTDDSARQFSLRLEPPSTIVFEIDDTSARRPETLRVPAPQLFDGAFHHVAATWDGAVLAVYVDAVLVASAPSRGGTLNPAPTVSFRLGSTSGPAAFGFDGILDEPSVWARALSAAEVGAVQNAGSAGKCAFVPVEQAKLTASTAGSDDRYGTSVGVNASTIVVGAPFSSQPGQFSGLAYVYTGSGSSWSEQAELVADDAANNDLNGWTVDVDGNTVVTGAYTNDAAGSNSGAAYVFTRSGTTWSQQQKLVPADAAAEDGLGYSVAIDGDTALVASVADDDNGQDSGAAYVFVRSGSTWTEQAKLVASDGAAFDNFGFWLDVDGDTAVIGAAGDNDGGAFNTGSAYVFVRSATTWTEQAKLVASDATAGDQFGHGVTVDGDVIAVGAPFDDDVGADSGSVYLFRRVGTAWSLEDKMFALDGATLDRFGSSVATNGSVVVIGAPRDGVVGDQRGSAYVFTDTGGDWTETTKLVPADNDTGDQFGISVAISGDVIVGAHNDDDDGNNSGSAYVFAP